MGRQPTHSAQRQALAHQQLGTNAKVQPHQEHRHPLSLPPRPASPPSQRPLSPSCRNDAYGRTEQQQTQPKTISVNTQALPQPIPEPFDDFSSGAWLFDQSRVPQWMAPHLPKEQVPQTHFSRNQSPLSPKGNRTLSPKLPSPRVSVSPQVRSAAQSPSPRASSPRMASSPSLPYGDEAYLWHGWSQWSGMPLWPSSQQNAGMGSEQRARGQRRQV